MRRTPSRRFIDYRAAVLIVIASMIGTGVFTTLGLQAEQVPDGPALLPRRREPGLPRPFRVPLYPLPPLVFLVVSGISLGVITRDRPLMVLAGAALLTTGWVLLRRRSDR